MDNATSTAAAAQKAYDKNLIKTLIWSALIFVFYWAYLVSELILDTSASVSKWVDTAFIFVWVLGLIILWARLIFRATRTAGSGE